MKYGYINFRIDILEYCDLSLLTEREQYYIYNLKPQYNILKVAGSSLGHKQSDESKAIFFLSFFFFFLIKKKEEKAQKDKMLQEKAEKKMSPKKEFFSVAKRSRALKGIYIGIKSKYFGNIASQETRDKMSIKKKGSNNPFFAKNHKDISKELMRNKALNRVHSIETKNKMSVSRGNSVMIYEKSELNQMMYINTLPSARKAALYLGISARTVNCYLKTGELFKGKYIFIIDTKL